MVQTRSQTHTITTSSRAPFTPLPPPTAVKEPTHAPAPSSPGPGPDTSYHQYIQQLCRVVPFPELDIIIVPGVQPKITLDRLLLLTQEIGRLIGISANTISIHYTLYVWVILFDLIERWLPVRLTELKECNDRLLTKIYNKFDEFIINMLHPSYTHQDFQTSREDCLTQFFRIRSKVGTILGKPPYKNFMPSSSTLSAHEQMIN